MSTKHEDCTQPPPCATDDETRARLREWAKAIAADAEQRFADARQEIAQILARKEVRRG